MTKVKFIGDFKGLLKIVSREVPEKVDVIVWPQGDRYDRGRKVVSLFRRGLAKKIVLTGNNVLVGKKRRPGTDDITLIKMAKWLGGRGIKSEDIIIDDKSFHTADQAKNVLKLAKKKCWKKIILVASFYHQPRAFLTFLARAKKIGWRGKIINQPARINWEKKPGGRNKKSKDLIFDEIKKIKKYKLWI